VIWHIQNCKKITKWWYFFLQFSMCLQFLQRDVMHITRTMLLQDVRPSVRLSVPHTPVLCRNGQTYHYTFFYQLSYRRSHNSTACSGFKRDWAAEKEKERRFSTIKSLYLVNDSRSAYIYTRKSHMGFQLVPNSITLNDRNAPSYTHSFSGVRCVGVNEDRPILSATER